MNANVTGTLIKINRDASPVGNDIVMVISLSSPPDRTHSQRWLVPSVALLTSLITCASSINIGYTCVYICIYVPQMVSEHSSIFFTEYEQASYCSTSRQSWFFT